MRWTRHHRDPCGCGLDLARADGGAPAVDGPDHLGETGPLSQGVQARRKALRICYINSMEVRKKRPRGFKKEAQGVQVSPLNPLSVAPC